MSTSVDFAMVTIIFFSQPSLPVSFHWCVSKQCNLPPGDICSPTMEHKNSCSLIVNHTFHNSGNYCVNVGVMNDVSGTNTSLMVQIPGKLYIYMAIHSYTQLYIELYIDYSLAPYTCGWAVNFVGSCFDSRVFLQPLQFSFLLKNQHFGSHI